MAGRQKNTASGLPHSNQVAGSRCAHDTISPDEKLLDAICRSNLCNDLNNFRVVVSPVTANNEEGILRALGDGLEQGSYKVLGVIGLLEDLDQLAETRTVELEGFG